VTYPETRPGAREAASAAAETNAEAERALGAETIDCSRRARGPDSGPLGGAEALANGGAAADGVAVAEDNRVAEDDRAAAVLEEDVADGDQGAAA